MKFKRLACFVAMTLCAAVAFPARLSAQETEKTKDQPRYKLIDLGTLGGPHSKAGGSQTVMLNNDRTFVGGADTSAPDPFSPKCFDKHYCFVEHAFQWHDRRLTDLGTVQHGSSSVAYAINQRGLVVGWSQNGLVDSTTGVPAYVPTVWRNGHALNLGTFGGAFGQVSAANDFGFVVGAAENATPDPFGFSGYLGIDGSMEIHAFGWWNGKMFDLGTWVARAPHRFTSTTLAKWLECHSSIQRQGL